MKDTEIDRIADWVVRRGLEGVDEAGFLREFCEKCQAAGLPVSRGLAFIDTLHPVHEGRLFRWRDDGVEEEATRDYGRSDQGAAADSWRSSLTSWKMRSGSTVCLLRHSRNIRKHS